MNLKGKASLQEKQRVMAEARRKKAEKGLYPGGRVPYGYYVDGTTGKLCIDERQSRAVQYVLKSNKISKSQIAAELNKEGYRTAEGAKFTHKQVGRILDRRAFYEDRFSYGSKQYTGKYEALVKNIHCDDFFEEHEPEFLYELDIPVEDTEEHDFCPEWADDEDYWP